MYRLRIELPSTGTVYTLTAGAGAYVMTGQAASLNYIGTITPIETGARNASTYLLQPLDYETRTVTLVPPHPKPGTYTYNLDTDGRSGFGPTWLQVDACINWMWTNPGGDWIDSAGTPQGPANWAIGAATAANGTEYSTNVTAATQYAKTNDRWLAFHVRPTGGPRTIAGRHTATPPRIDVTYSDGTPSGTLACKTSALIGPSSSLPNTFGAGSGGNLPISNNLALLEFERPAGVVATATLKYVVVTHFGVAGGLAFNLLDPPTSNAAGPVGVAATAGLWDENIEIVPGILGAQRYVDSAVESDFISTINMSGRNNEWSPEFWGGAVNTAKLPHIANHPTTGKPRWFNAKYPGVGSDIELRLVSSSYTGEGFVPLRPGLGAIRAQIPRLPAADTGVDGYIGGGNGTTGSIAKLAGIPPDKIGLLRRLRTRFYARVHIDRPLVLSDRRINFSDGLSGRFTALTGKWGISGAHDCTMGGVSGTSGSGWGWQMRLQFNLSVTATPGPDENKFIPGVHVKSDYNFKALPGYQYSANGYLEQFGKIGGYGGTVNYDEWFLVETDIKLNSVTTSGLGYVPDGHIKVWINDRQVMNDTGMAFVSLPLNIGVRAATITAGAGNVGNGTCVSNANINPASGMDASFHCFPETLTLLFTDSSSYTIIGSFRGSYGTGTVGVPYSTNRHAFTVSAGATPFAAGDTFQLVYPPYITDVPNSSILTPMRELGFRDIWLNCYHGGLDPSPRDITFFYAGLAWADGDLVDHIGPMVLDAVETPAWRPAAGDAVQLSVSGGTLAGDYADSCAPYYGKYWHPNILNAYSGGVYNPWHGTYGAYVCFGSGHAGTNDNSVLALELGTNACTWRRLTNPTPFAGTGTDPTTQGTNSIGHYGGQIDWDWGENAGIDGQPCSDHSYGSLTIVGPGNGGHANGTLRRVQQATLNIEANGSPNLPAVLAGHKLDFVNTAGTSGNAWARLSATPRRDVAQNAPQWSVFVPDRNATFVESMASAHPRWYDHSSGTPTNPWVTGTGTARLITGAGSEPGAAIFYVPERKLILCLDAATSGSGLRIQYMDVDPAIAQPSWVTSGVTLSSPISIPDGWTTACWCPDNNRIIVGGAGGAFVARSGTTNTYACNKHYEIAIPATLSNPWTVSTVTYPSGQVVNYSVFQGYNRFAYAPAAKCIVWANWMSAPGRPGPSTDEIYAISPSGT